MEGTVNPAALEASVAMDPEALKGLEFYTENYEQMTFAGLGIANRQIVLGIHPHADSTVASHPRGHSRNELTRYLSFWATKPLNPATNAINAMNAFLRSRTTWRK
jgi:hypothetical protein